MNGRSLKRLWLLAAALNGASGCIACFMASIVHWHSKHGVETYAQTNALGLCIVFGVLSVIAGLILFIDTKSNNLFKKNNYEQRRNEEVS